LEKERLQKILSAHGIASRRKAEQMILDGKVAINGITAMLGQSATPGQDIITVDGVPLEERDKHVYIVLNKPSGFLTTVSDEFGRKTVMELVSDVGMKVYPVGRLDLDTEGLLIFTNDGEFANRVMHPSFNLQKTYLANIRGDVDNAIELMREPLVIDSYTVYAVHVDLLKRSNDGGVLKITIAEGRNRQIRKMCTACGVAVKTLKRISVGTLKLGDLKLGSWRYLSDEEILALGTVQK